MKITSIKKVTISLLFATTTITGFAFTSAEDFLRGRGSDRESFDQIYIQGVANGFMWANARLKAIGQKPLYCQSNISLNADNLVNILEKTVAKFSIERVNPVEMALLRGLIDTFPCNK